MSQNLIADGVVYAEQAYAELVASGERKYGPNGTHIPISASEREQTFLHRWERMVRLFGTKPAVKEPGRTLTYEELNRLANRLAHAILARQNATQMASDAPVALLIDVERDLPVGVIATWKAGKFLTWLEARQPLNRNQFIVEESGAAIVVTNRKHEAFARQLMPQSEDVIVIEELAEDLPISNPPITIDGSSPAYLIYTSGSTGKPKGTVDLHRNVVYFMAARQMIFQFGPQDRAALLLYGVGCMFSMAAALLFGGCVMPFQMKNEGIDRLNNWLIDYHVTVIVGGADLRTWLLSLDGSQQFPDLRFIALSAGPSYREHVEAYQRYLPDDCMLINLYSATEFRCGGIFIIDKQTRFEGRILPAGYNTTPTTFEIWDEAENPLPIGTSGEIVVCSPYVAAGYWKSPELTASKFGVDRLGRRCFRTGDLGRLDADGCLWVLGRMDGQFKIRGNRVETAEVEVAMRELPGVQEAAVIHQGETDEDRILIGYVATASDLSGNEFRKQLATGLPDYMIPSIIVVLDELPLNANGKVDRPALRAIQVTPQDADLSSGASSRERGNAALRLPFASVTPEGKLFAQPLTIGKQHYHPSGEHFAITMEEMERSVVHRWESIVERFGDNRALEEGEQTLTYYELNAQMNLVAHAILARKVPQNLPVAIMVDIEGDLAVSIFGIWKAGNYFVWLEPGQPAARHHQIIEDSEATLIVTNRGHAELARDLFNDKDCVIIIEDLIDEASKKQAQTNPPITVDGDSPAYLIYTSGSTGKPKGTIDTHRNLLGMMLVRQGLLHFSPRDRLSLLVRGSGWSFACLGALLYGGCLLPYRAKEEGFVRFSQWLIDRRITMTIGGAILRTWLLTLDGRQSFPDIRAITMGASPSYAEHLQAFQRYLPENAIFLNTYSATEVRSCTIFAMDKSSRLESRMIPAGYPTLHGAVEIWDENDKPLPVGETGEVVAITPYTAIGYWKLPELTASRFGVDGRGRHYYRMGDLGRLDKDGCLWVLGRKDGQTKIRGNRVEIAEIEATLREFPDVEETAVIAIGDSDETRILIAYVASKAELAGNVLRNQLAARLPEYMVPSTIVVLEELPYNGNGKVARPLLRDMAIAFSKVNSTPKNTPSTAVVASITGTNDRAFQGGNSPQSETEERVAAFINELLDGVTIGRQDNFFDMGGHSLLAARLMSVIHRNFGVDLTPRDFLADPTVVGLSARIDQIIQKEPRHTRLESPIVDMGVEMVPLVDGLPTNLPIFSFPGWNGARENSLRYELLIRQLGNQWPYYGFVVDGRDENNRIFATMDELVAASLRLIRRVQPHGPYTLLGSCTGGKLAYALAQALLREGEEISALVFLDVPAIPSAVLAATEGTNQKDLNHHVRYLKQRFNYHRKEVAKLGFQGGMRYLVEHLTALLPKAVHPDSPARQQQIAHKRYADVLSNYMPREPYNQPVAAIFTPGYKKHQEYWQALMPQMEVTVLDAQHLDFIRTHTDEVGRVIRKALKPTAAG